MCLIRVKEEDDYAVPPRVVRRERRRSPPDARRSSRIAYIQPRPPSVERTYIIQAPPPPPVVQEPQPEPVEVKAPTPPPAPKSVKSVHEPRTQSHYVEVSPDSASSSGTSTEDVRSRTTSKSRHTDARSEYHLREREYRREREQAGPREEYEHYRYVRAPPERGGYEGRRSIGARGSFADDPKSSRTSYRRERERVVVVGNDGRTTREYRR